MTDRNIDGTFAQGNNANPTGENGHLAGWTRYGTRLQRFLAMPLDEIEALIASPEFRKYSAIDRAAVFQSHRVADKVQTEHIAERERANERIEGKATQSVKHGGDPDNPTPISMDGVFTLTFGTEDNDGSDPAAPTT